MKKMALKRWHILAAAAAYACVSALVLAPVAYAHDAPPGDEYEMADWMLFSFMIFFGVGLIAFLTALRRGWLRQPEDAKYYVLTIDEKDYYTPDWARDAETDASLAAEEPTLQETIDV